MINNIGNIPYCMTVGANTHHSLLISKEIPRNSQKFPEIPGCQRKIPDKYQPLDLGKSKKIKRKTSKYFTKFSGVLGTLLGILPKKQHIRKV
jgi:hypothetical protein